MLEKLENAIQHRRWEDLPLQSLAKGLNRRFITGKQGMIAQLYLAKNAVVPWHYHHNEQITYVIQGALEFHFGEQGNETDLRVIRTGEVLVIPSNLPHMVIALEETLDVDFFAPPRQDWIDGTDSYFRTGEAAAQ